PFSHISMQVVAATEDAAHGQRLEEGFLLTPATYRTHLATDKPMYQPGETVRFRSLTLERFSLQPAKERLSLRYTITTPQQAMLEIPQGNFLQFAQQGVANGAAVFGPEDAMRRGIGGGEWD